MPSGRTHELINTATLITGLVFLSLQRPALPSQISEVLPASLGGTAGTADAAFMGFIGCYLIGTFLITPDLDLANTKGHGSDAQRRWGPLSGLWTPYGKISRHRGLSHSYLAGPISRALYLMIIATILIFIGVIIAQLTGRSIPELQLHNQPIRTILAATAGYFISQWLHLIADRIPPWRLWH